jgi:hypothetical protein
MTTLILKTGSLVPSKLFRLLGITRGVVRETVIFSLKLVWLLIFVCVLIPLAWLAIEIVNHR